MAKCPIFAMLSVMMTESPSKPDCLSLDLIFRISKFIKRDPLFPCLSFEVLSMMEEQLGLKLESIRAPVVVLVIDMWRSLRRTGWLFQRDRGQTFQRSVSGVDDNANRFQRRDSKQWFYIDRSKDDSAGRDFTHERNFRQAELEFFV
jgi:hypothetical protein